MRRTLATALMALAVIGTGVLLATATPSSADRGGCPHEFPPDKPGAMPERPEECRGEPSPTPTPTATPVPPTETPAPTLTPTPVPTPDPTPEPTPVPTPSPTPAPTPVSEADLKVNSVSVTAPASATRLVAFLVTGSASLHDNGPLATVLADVTFTLNLPPDCTASSSTTARVLNRTLNMSVPVAVSRSWNVTCTQGGFHQFIVDASVSFSAGQTASDPNTTNNAGSGTGTTQVN